MGKFKVIGILGGMGPYVTSYFYKMILDLAHKNFAAVQDYEYPQIIINSLALKGSDEKGVGRKKIILDQLIFGIRTLNQAGVDFIVMPCNSSHSLISELRKFSRVPILNIVDITANQVIMNHPKRVAILASEIAYHDHIYEKSLCQLDAKLIPLSQKDRAQITQLIFDVMGGNTHSSSRYRVLKIIESLHKDKGAEGIILGCTELSLVISQKDTQVKIYDSLRILAEGTLRYADQNSKKYNVYDRTESLTI